MQSKWRQHAATERLPKVATLRCSPKSLPDDRFQSEPNRSLQSTWRPPHAAMKPPTSEQAFESAIECALLHGGPGACPHYQAEVREPAAPYALSFAPGGYRRRTSADYDRELCLIPKDVIDFLVASQPKEWRRLRQHRGAGHRDQFLNRLAGELSRRGVVDVLRNGVKDSGCKFDLVAYFRPASGLNEETRRLHATNLFAVVRQLHLQHEERKQSRPRHLSERHPGLHRGTQEPPYRAGCSGRRGPIPA